MSILPTYEQQRRLLQVRDFTEALTEWQAATGADRGYWRDRLRDCIATERTHLATGHAQLWAAVANSQQKRAA